MEPRSRSAPPRTSLRLHKQPFDICQWEEDDEVPDLIYDLDASIYCQDKDAEVVWEEDHEVPDLIYDLDMSMDCQNKDAEVKQEQDSTTAVGESMPHMSVQCHGDAERCWSQDWTTVVVRNVPRSFCLKDLGNVIQGMGFEGCVNFINLPEDRKGTVNRGYSFLNFCIHTMAVQFLEAIHGREWNEEWLGSASNPVQQ